ncbi:hypothetical protein [Commensalibacter oyaizuii]|uniref:DUF1254 domain-containing protein n=1 Tax=Commensalibacter oyaizuii TaxID=3043873 RepID=A0ABT6Q2Y7_9PROT|nr:hypothetical protein [Commensalibacter sp. TBRC 16381]MDI2091483.1 hypothetical protein [Commensalibacter sp. TBRC 16381]
MSTFFINSVKKMCLLTVSIMAFSTAYISQTYAQTTYTSQKIEVDQYQKFGEWRYNPHFVPPTLMWWNDRMSMVPVLYISFLPDKIVLDAVTPVWPDTGIIFYLKDKKRETSGLNLTLQRRDKEHCFYSATIYGADRQNFINSFVTSHKARIITPSSYSQSLSLKHVDEAMQLVLSSNPGLGLTLPNSISNTK